MSTDPVIDRIAKAIELGQGANRETAATFLGEKWDEVGPSGNPLHRGGIAHALADLQTQPEDELFWDLQALLEVDRITDEHRGLTDPTTPGGMWMPACRVSSHWETTATAT